MKIPWRRVFLIAIGLGVVALLVYSFLPKPVEVDLAHATRGPLMETVQREGKTRVKERYVISAPLAGSLQRVRLDPGDAVKSTEPILVIEPRDPELLDARAREQAQRRVDVAKTAVERAKHEIDKAVADHDLAHNQLQTAQRLWNRGNKSISRDEYDEAINKEQAAHAALKIARFSQKIADYESKLAKAALIRTRPLSPGDDGVAPIYIHSPIDGQVLKVIEESTTTVSPGDDLIEIGNPAELECEIDLLSTDAVKVKKGAKVFLEHWGGKPLLGQVRLVEPSGFTKVSALGVEEQRVNVIVDFLDPLQVRKKLGHAYRVEARIVLWESDDVLKIPAGALFRSDDDWAVFLVVDGYAKLHHVKVGHNNGLEAEILDGLNENDTVVLYPSDKIRDGVAIKPRD